MAGHSKWANIKHRKGAQDKKRGKIFTKLIHEITIAAKLGGADSDTNPRLRTAIAKALAGNMPKDTVIRAVKRGARDDAANNLEEIRYEGYGPYGIAVMVDCLTDNKNRTVAELRHAFTKVGGNLGTEGSVAYLFETTGEIELSCCEHQNNDQIMEIAIEAGAEDIYTENGRVKILTSPQNLQHVRKELLTAGASVEQSEVTWLASAAIDISDLENAKKISDFLSALDDLDDVQTIYSNVNIAEDILNQLSD
jgi:YebC/PmpR family DNA-binding regulatory protein